MSGRKPAHWDYLTGLSKIALAPQKGDIDGSEEQFGRVALLTGRPLYWSTGTVGAEEYARRVMRLFDWCRELPNIRIGLSARSLGQILQSVYRETNRPVPPAIAAAFDRLYLRVDEVASWPADAEIWADYVPPLQQWVTSAQEVDEYIWLSPDEIDAWRAGTAKSLADYGKWNLDPSTYLQLLGRHKCTLFAPLDGRALWDHVMELFSQLPPKTERDGSRP